MPEELRIKGPEHDLMEDVFDVVIIGAGPCGLAVAARLNEPVPAAIFTDEEHRRYQWLRAHGSNVVLKHLRSGRTMAHTRETKPRYRLAVLDATANSWMARWNNRFRTLDIPQLRSPLPWHLDPKDLDSLRGFAHRERRCAELVEIKGCVGKELSKHAKKRRQAGRTTTAGPNQNAEINERERNDYYTASRELFESHCEFVQQDYGLCEGLVHHETVTDVTFHPGRSANCDEKLFAIHTNKCCRYARAVVFAVGPNHKPNFPQFALEIPRSLPPRDCCDLPQACHSAQIKTIPDEIVRARIDLKLQTNVLVIGGGLTSAQISDLAIRRGVTRIYHLMRGPCRVKPFDLELTWMSKYRNPRLAQFWLADTDVERLELIKNARGGGSLTPTYYKKLMQHKAAGRLYHQCFTTLKSARFIPQDELEGHQGGYWRVETDPPIPDLPLMDYIYFATGMPPDFRSFPCLRSISSQYPVDHVAGLPCLTDQLKWRDDVPLFITGALAGLRVGPGAGNLGGARLAAERIALEIERMGLGQASDGEVRRAEEDDAQLKYSLGLGSKFSALRSS